CAETGRQRRAVACPSISPCARFPSLCVLGSGSLDNPIDREKNPGDFGPTRGGGRILPRSGLRWVCQERRTMLTAALSLALGLTFRGVAPAGENDKEDRGRVVDGPAPRRLAMHPLQAVDGDVVAAGGFTGRVGRETN